MLVENDKIVEDPIIARSAIMADSSWIDMLAGLSLQGIRKIPPGFWANAVPQPDIAISNALAAAAQSWSAISIASLSFIEVAERPLPGDRVSCRARDLRSASYCRCY